MIELKSKLPNAGTTIFTVMTQLAQEHGAINLSQGFPDFEPPPRLLELVTEHLEAGHNQYAPMTGVESLKTAIAAKLSATYGVNVDADREITVTAGGTEALFCAIHAVVRNGDEVIVFDPAYDSYEPAITLAGGVTRHVALSGSSFGVDWERLAAVLNPRTRLVIVNSPHNPTGALLSMNDLDRLAELLRPYDCFLVSDEVYEHIVFDGSKHASILAQPELAERAFCVSSFGKTYHATGWKLGYCAAPARLSEEFRRVHQFVMFAAVAPMQHALAQFLTECPEHYAELPDFYQQKRDYFLNALENSRLTAVPTRSTYFQLVDFHAVSDRNDVEFARWLTIEHGVASIPISVFCESPPGTSLVRFCFAKQARTIDEAGRRLSRL